MTVIFVSPAWGAVEPTLVAQGDEILLAKRKKKRVNINKIRDKYWAQDSSYDVLQERMFSKKKKFEIQLLGGAIFSDPFLNVNQVGASIGYHMNEYFSLSVLGWKSFSRNSTALDDLEKEANASTDNNPPEAYGGAEASISVVYGKLSWLSKNILYFDLHLLAGLGLSITENGSFFAQHGGFGQQIWITRTLAARIDYRLMHYTETILGKNPADSENFGKDLGPRHNWSNVLGLGISFIL